MLSGRRTIRLAIVAILGVTMGASAYFWEFLTQVHEKEVQDTLLRNEQQVRLMNEAVDQQVAAIIRSVDIALTHLRLAYLYDRQNFAQFVENIQQTYPKDMVQFVTVFDAEGYLAYSSNGSTERLYFGDREHFRVHTGHDRDELFISKPIIGRIANIPLIQLTRPIRDGDRLVGVIGIPLRPDYLSKRLFDLHANPDDLLSVLREDGSFITRSRNLQEALNTQVAPSRPFLRARPGEKGLFRDVSTVDKIPLLFSWSRLKEWPLAVVVASNEAVGLGVLRQHQADERLRAILGTGALVIFSFTLAWLLWRLARVNAALAVSEGRFREQSERLQIAINGVNDGIWDWNLSTGELYLSPKWKEMLGYSDQELPNAHATFECLLHADDRPLVAKAVQRYLQGEIPVYAVECRLRHKDGSWRWILTRGEALRDADGKPYRMAGSHTDITDRKHLEGSLREHMRELTAILRSSSVGICHVKDRRVVWSNRRMGEIFGFTPDQMQGQSTRIFFVSQESFDALGRDAYPLLARGERYISEQEMGHQDGAQVWVRISGQAIAPEDQSAGSIWIFEDIAEQKATEQALIKAREAAEAANVAKTRFLAAMSHEIRTPMNGILGMAQLLVSQQVTENERREYARTILNSGQTLMTLLNDILDLSKVEAGKLTLHLVGFGPDQLLEEIAGLFRPTARQKDIAIKSTWLGTRLPRYRGDPHRLRQMLSNLVGNAIKFSSQGQIDILGQELERRGDLALVEFSVEDTGIGIPQDQLPLLFKPFSQADGSNTRSFGGTGLGLSIVSNLARLMDGDVGVESRVGQGSRFWFRIYLGLVVPGESMGQAERLSDLGNRDPSLPQLEGRVLLVEDWPSNRQIIAALLGKLGVGVIEAENGQQGLDLIRQGEAVDLVLMDIHMPTLDGYAAATEIRQWEQDNRRPRVPIVALTADAFNEARQQALACGMDEFLTKPVDLRALQRLLARWLEPQPQPQVPVVYSVPPAPEVAAIENLLRQLWPMLVQHKFSAIARYQDLTALVAGTELAEAIAEARRPLDDMRFDLTLKRLRELAAVQHWQVPPS